MGEGKGSFLRHCLQFEGCEHGGDLIAGQKSEFPGIIRDQCPQAISIGVGGKNQVSPDFVGKRFRPVH